MKNRNGRLVAAAIPVVLVNIVAFAGQLAFLRDHLPWPLAGQVLMAVTLETIAVYLAFHAHVAAVANDSALRLRLAAYAFALVIAAMNYSHYADGWRPTFAAVAVALCSAASPWLWGIHSRRASRDVLLEQGLIEPHALRLGSTRWMWHPLRSCKVMFRATWEGITDPAEAIGAGKRPAVPARPPMPGRRQVREDYSAGAETAKKITTALQARDRTWLAAFNGHGGKHGHGGGPHE